MSGQRVLPSEFTTEILAFWFGEVFDSREAIPGDRLRLWFGGQPETDRMIRQRFAGLLDRAEVDDVRSHLESPRERLALILLFDQFPRNIFRGSPKAFAYDALARSLALDGMATGDDLELPPVARAFFSLPLEHAEDLALQEQSVAAFDLLCQLAPPKQAESFASFYDYAVRHRDVIARFGRFPHRNKILGRSSSAEELAFLQQPNSSF